MNDKSRYVVSPPAELRGSEDSPSKIQQGSIEINYQSVASMQVDYAILTPEIQSLLRDKVETECFLCLCEFDTEEYAPVMMCINQHSCCGPCMQQLLRVETSKQLACPHCNQPINRKAIAKNRYLLTVFQIVQAFTRQIKQLTDQLETTRKSFVPSLKASLSARQPNLASSFILPDKRDSFLQESTLIEECPTSRSQTWIGGGGRRREALLRYAQREKIEELKRLAVGDTPLEEVTKIRSGYGTIKKIECMELFLNLKELLLYNNHIRIIEGLAANLKLNVLSLAYNRIEKAENLAHLKELKRLCLECNRLGKSSAEYLSLYEWKNLQSLTISFHQQSKEDNDQCFAVLFAGKSLMQWSGLKTLYIYNSKMVGERGRSVVREFVGRRKNPLQVYWS